jgi:hypothetical protein
MLVLRVEMWPGGDVTKKRTIGLAALALQGVTPEGVRSYVVKLFKAPEFGGPATDEAVLSDPAVWRQGVVTGHVAGPRGTWDLIGGALKVLLSERLNSYKKGEPNATRNE